MAEKWIIPCNIKVYDVIEHFKQRDKIIWKNSFTIRPGDIVYLYLSAPYSEIKYKCIVVRNVVDKETLQNNSYAIPTKKFNNFFSKKEKFIELEYVCEFAKGTFPLPTLKKNGLGQVQIQARIDRRLQQYIDRTENHSNDNE